MIFTKAIKLSHDDAATHTTTGGRRIPVWGIKAIMDF
jgi:hypothetical protein